MLQTVFAVFKDLGRFFWPLTNRKKLIRAAIAIALIIAFVVFTKQGDVTPAETESSLPIVRVGTVADSISTGAATFIGTVRAVAEAQIEAEISGRVVSVPVTLGDTVAAGQAIVRLESQSEYATLLQAEGAYEAALANAAQSNVSVSEAETAFAQAQNTAISTYRGAYNTINDAVLNTIDDFFANPESSLPGVRISSGAFTNELNTTRVSLQTSLPAWRDSTAALTQASDLVAAEAAARENTQTVLRLIDVLLDRVAHDDNDNRVINGNNMEAYQSTLTSLRTSITAVTTSLDSARTTLDSAEEALERATIGGTDAELSAANAAVKQALGSLRSAQANFEKTVLRSPIAGTVNSLSVNTGDFLGSFTQVAEVANNDALEISIFVGESDRSQIAIGDTVTIEGGIAGTVTNIAPAIDPTTQKVEVKIATESANLTNGDTVTIGLTQTSTSEDVERPLLVPITAVKFTVTDGAMFTVEDGTLISRPVAVGPIVGSLVTILSGIDRETEFVVDARGLTPGQAVEVLSQ